MQCGIGWPVINKAGEIVGMSCYYDEDLSYHFCHYDPYMHHDVGQVWVCSPFPFVTISPFASLDEFFFPTDHTVKFKC